MSQFSEVRTPKLVRSDSACGNATSQAPASIAGQRCVMSVRHFVSQQLVTCRGVQAIPIERFRFAVVRLSDAEHVHQLTAEPA